MLSGFFSWANYIIDERFFKAFLFTDPWANFEKLLIFWGDLPRYAPVLNAKIFSLKNVNSTIQELCCSYEWCSSFYIFNSPKKGGVPMVFFTLFLLFVFPFLQAGPFDNWVSFLTWMVFIVIPLIVCVLLCITVTHEDNNDSKKNWTWMFKRKEAFQMTGEGIALCMEVLLVLFILIGCI